MATRVGLGPVFAVEWRLASRRWQAYALRSLTVLLMLGAMSLIWYDSPAAWEGATGGVTLKQQAQVGRTFYGITTIILLGLIGLTAPAATAGAVCLDKARGNLTLVFATDLSDPEIILGKLAARLVPVLGMVLCAAPVMSIATLFGGVDPLAVVGGLCVVLSCAVFGCSLALTLSVWGRKAHEVLMATYVFGLLYLMAAPVYAGVRPALFRLGLGTYLPSFWELLRFHPVYLVLAAVNNPAGLPPVTFATQAGFLGLGLAASAVLLAVATWRVRSVAIRQLGRGEQGAPAWRLGPFEPGRLYDRLRRHFPRPALDRNPVLWRECQRRRPSAWTLAIWGGYALVCGGLSVYAVGNLGRARNWPSELCVMVNAAQVAGGLLLLSVSAATSLAEERQRGSLDVLMATPLSTRSIVWGKWWGVFRGVPPLLVLPLLVTAGLGWVRGNYWGVPLMAALILAYGAAVTSLGLAVATWVPQLGRATGLTVGLYTFVCVGWVPLSLIAFGDGPGDSGPGVASASPLIGVGALSESLVSGASHDVASQVIWTLFWIGACAGLALALLLATLATFNRCLGRVDDPTLLHDGDRPRRRPQPRPSRDFFERAGRSHV